MKIKFMEKEKITEILEIIGEIINEFNNLEIESILKQQSKEEQRLLNPFRGSRQERIINYRKFFQLALEEKNYERVDWKRFYTQFRELVRKIYDKNEVIGEELLGGVDAELDRIKALLTQDRIIRDKKLKINK